ncbi:MAG: prepilin peptidase, partial [bacterium]|nr:prepilin peptidase [bacterium]
IPWYFNIPILSYLLLKGRCAFCGWKIPLRYLAVELFCSISFLLSSIKFEPFEAIFVSIFAVLTILAAGIDLERRVIYDFNNILIFFTGILYLIIFKKNLVFVVVGALASTLILYISKYIVEKRKKLKALGEGDIYFVIAVSPYLGIKELYGLSIAALLGAVVNYYLIHSKKLDKNEEVPFIPYLTAGFLIALFFL